MTHEALWYILTNVAPELHIRRTPTLARNSLTTDGFLNNSTLRREVHFYHCGWSEEEEEYINIGTKNKGQQDTRLMH